MEMDGPDSEMDGSMSNNEDELSDLHDEDSDEQMGRHVDDGETDILSKLKQQVRNMDRERDDIVNTEVSNGTPTTRGNTSSPPFTGHHQFSLPLPFPFPHPAAAAAAAAFLPPVAPYPSAMPTTCASSGSSHSSDSSNSSQQQTWSFEEQFKQVRQLYEISDDPKRKEFLDDLFSFMQKRGTPINRLPIMAKSVLDLYELYNLVIARGGLVDVINKKLWQEIIKGLHLPSSITSAAFTLRTQYMKYLYPYECEKRRLSTPSELQAAIDGNRREGRRTSYGNYPDLMRRSPGPHVGAHPQQLSQQMSPLGLGPLGLRPGPLNGGINGNGHLPHPALHPALGQPPLAGPVPSLAPADFEARMVEYVRLLNKELRSPSVRPNSPPPSTSPREALNAFEMSKLTLWNLYNNNNPPTPEPQKEALNLGTKEDSKQQISVKREQVDEGNNGPPPKKIQTVNAQEEEEKTGETFGAARSSGNHGAAHIKISNTGEDGDKESSITVSMEINGTMYQGVLFAQGTRTH